MSTAKPHVVIFSNRVDLEGGGVARACHHQALSLKKYFKITIVTCSTDVDFDSPEIQVVVVPRPRVNWLRRFSHAVREFALARRYKTAALTLHRTEAFQFAIFHSHTGAAIVGPYLKSAGVKYQSVTHGDIFTRPKGAYDFLLTRLYRWATRKSYRECDFVQALSPFMQKRALANGGSASNVTVLPNGVCTEPAVFTRTEKKSLTPVRLLYVGRLSLEKDVATLIRALAQLIGQRSNVDLVIVGDGPKKRECVALADKLGVSKAITFSGQLNSQAVADLYLSSDVFCITSVSDPLPTVVLEAMMHGLPVVGTQIDGIPFMVKHNENGYLVNAGDSKAIADFVNKLVENQALRLAMGRRSVALINQSFRWPIIADKLAKHITKLISHSASR